MKTLKSSQQNLVALNRHALLVIFICYFPHITTEPLWLFIIFLAAIVYRLMADYYHYRPLTRWLRFLFVIGSLVLLNGDVHSSQFLVQFLLIFIILKCLEMQTIRDLKVLILCNFLLMFSALIVIQEMWTIIYLFIAILANLSLMLKISAPEVTLRQLSSKSSQQLLFVIPLSIALFYIFPRIDPLWQVPALSRTGPGFSETMNFGTIADMYDDDTTVMQITFKKNPILNGYWRGIILTNYTGDDWRSATYNDANFSPLQELKANETADYAVLLEPQKTKWLFYAGYPAAGGSRLMFSPDHGLTTQNKDANAQRFAYSIKVEDAPYAVLNPAEYTDATQLPANINPRLNAWAKEQFAKTHNDVPTFLVFLRNYIRHQPFWYTLTPPALAAERNPMDSFWFDTQKGFCEHYASAVTFILRSVGIPARIVIGFQGGQWNPIANAIVIQRNDAHAWLEYWQTDIGWRELDPTSFIAPERIDQSILVHQIDMLNQRDYFNIATLPIGKQMRFFLESVRFFSERWFLFYNQNTQQNLLQYVGLKQWQNVQLLQAFVGCLILFLILIGSGYHWRQSQLQDTLLMEYHLLQKEFRRFQIATNPAATLIQQCQALIDKVPGLATLVFSFLDRYEQLRLKQSRDNRKETIALFRNLRNTLHRRKFI